MTEASRSIVGGTCHVFHAFEVGYSIDIDQAAQRVSGAGRIALASSDRNVAGADFESRPLRVSIELAPITHERFTVIPRAHVTIFHFGAMSVRLDLPLTGATPALPQLARTLVGQADLLHAARTVATEVLILISYHHVFG